MTRRALAQASGTSERYLALLESGEGNPTLGVLDGLARALGVPLLDFVPLARDAPEDEARAALLRRVARADAEMLARLARVFDGEAEPAARAQRVALIGLRGAGKTTLGQALAGRLGCPFVEIDKLVEEQRGAPVATLFEVYGQATFRRYEREALEAVLGQHQRAVIAAAGGVVAEDGTYRRLLAATHVVWLQASPAEHMRRVMAQGDFRPMQRNRDAMRDLVAILEARAAAYGQAHARLDTSGEGVEACLERLEGIVAGLFANG